MEKLSKIAPVLAVVALLVGGLALLKSPQVITHETVVEKQVGALPGPDVFIPMNFRNGHQVGGVFSTSTGDIDQTLTTKQLSGISTLAINPGIKAKTFTLPKNVELAGVGSFRTILIVNATTTSSSVVPGPVYFTIARGEDQVLLFASSTLTEVASLGTGKSALVTFSMPTSTATTIVQWDPFE